MKPHPLDEVERLKRIHGRCTGLQALTLALLAASEILRRRFHARH